MLIHPQFDPVALSLGPVSIHWYGITYLVAFLLFLWLARSRLQHAPYATLANRGIWKVQHIDDLMTYGVLGVVLGGRIGYCLFYQPSYYAAHPLEIAYIWQGGMSFQGRRPVAAPSVADLPVFVRGFAAVCGVVVVGAQTATHRLDLRCFLAGLWQFSFYCRVFPRARCTFGFVVHGLVDGAVVMRPDGIGRYWLDGPVKPPTNTI